MSTVGAYEGSAAINSSLSQPVSAAEVGATPYHSRTLPRPRRSHGVSAASSVGPASTRRQIVSSRVSDYLKSLNSMTRSIVLEKEYVEERHGEEWPVMDETLQEDVVDDYFMPADVHAHYGTLPRSRRSSISGSYREPHCNLDESRLYSSTRVMPVSFNSDHSIDHLLALFIENVCKTFSEDSYNPCNQMYAFLLTASVVHVHVLKDVLLKKRV